MLRQRKDVLVRITYFVLALIGFTSVGCGPYYEDYRRDGYNAAMRGDYGPARYFFLEADRLKRRQADNLHDVGACSVMLAKQKFQQMNHAAAMRELDVAISYYTSAIDASPGHQAAIEGKNVALELKGKFDEALKHAEWAAEFVGPSAKQYLFLARELEQRGDKDGALLRYRQAVAVEPNNATAHVGFAKFLMRCENQPAAIEHLQIAHRLNPSDTWVVEQLSAQGVLPASLSKNRPEP